MKIINTLMLFFFLLITNSITAQGPQWKEEAIKRIDLYRKNNITIHVLNEQGLPLKNALIDIKLVRHKFQFGAVVEDDFMASKYTDIYKRNFANLFNAAGFENGLKQKQRGNPKEKASEIAAEWFTAHNITMRGHTLVYDGLKFLRSEEKEIITNKDLSDTEKAAKVIPLMEQHIEHGIKKWNVTAWDVLNEPIENHAANDLTPNNLVTYWFKRADYYRKLYNRPGVKLYINENRIISGTTKDTYARPKKYKDIIREVINEGGPIEGIGFQSRIKNGFVSPEEMYKRLQYFDEFNLSYQATEFEVRDQPKFRYTDIQKQQIVEQFMLIYLSHPKVEGIWHWTFNNNKKGNKPWALFNYDGTPTACGKQWIKTFSKEFNTQELLNTNNIGTAKVRGFKGDYIIRVSYKGKNKYVKLYLDKDQEISVKM
ncbi:endo-1,4-beta-xylanase [Wenyingzhuangia sp. chi5]|uniref:Beta-xylanase n=1 Tax=Wenyingzhuangia gilva TaxID=3057677 RepID=A0ABT8VTY4_9FLAO|nr:endo-1,4-beta-xylanase [Wenyingzhuangia sp. chi5]MDO3695437.1 endo-1,4-beta-xylanase [Wenyingzhuangia sp. chi5]